MNIGTTEHAEALILARRQNAAWQLLASHRAPLVLSCLKALLSGTQQDVRYEDALQSLSELLSQHAALEEFQIESEDYLTQARKELRTWIKRELLFERDGFIYATDALESALRFVESLESRILTSTGSRLSLVQSGIEALEEKLNPDPAFRAGVVRRRIENLQHELSLIEAGHFEVLTDEKATEGIRDIYRLASDLKVDFRRVEESWRAQGIGLRQSVVNAQHNRGQVVEQLLCRNEELLETPEGRAFEGFYTQLNREVELANMRVRLQSILAHPISQKALLPQQRDDLRWLVPNLVRESHAVLHARGSIERDVRAYLRTGLAVEHHRVGVLLNELFAVAGQCDWTRDQRRAPSPLPPLGFPISGLPLVQRLRFTIPGDNGLEGLDLVPQFGDLDALTEEFWAGFEGLDRFALIESTKELLKLQGRALAISDLARLVNPEHDLEAIALWVALSMAIQIPVTGSREQFELITTGGTVRYDVPAVEMVADSLTGFSEEI